MFSTEAISWLREKRADDVNENQVRRLGCWHKCVPTLDDKIDENYRVFYIEDRPEVGHVHMLFAISTANYWL